MILRGGGMQKIERKMNCWHWRESEIWQSANVKHRSILNEILKQK